MIWFLNTIRTFPDLKASPLTPERFENKHPHKDAFCQRALNLLNMVGYDAPWQWMDCAIPIQCQMAPSCHKQAVMDWRPGRGCWEPPGATTGILRCCQEGMLHHCDGQGGEKICTVAAIPSQRSRRLYSRKRRRKAFWTQCVFWRCQPQSTASDLCTFQQLQKVQCTVTCSLARPLAVSSSI